MKLGDTMNLALAILQPAASKATSSLQSLRILSQEKRLVWRAPEDEKHRRCSPTGAVALRVVVAIARGYKGYGLPQADLTSRQHRAMKR